MVTALASDCAQCCWKTTNACSDSLLITAFSAVGNITLAVDFAGRGKVGGYCGGSDEYVTFSNQGGTSAAFAIIDVWQAFRDGIWSSSTTVLIYQVRTGGGTGGTTAKPQNDTLNTCRVSGNLGFSLDTGVCPSSLSWTVTVLDDGTLSIA